MEQNKVHISLLIIFTALFALFNVGLPVVVHYCEMMKTTSNSDCGMCHTGKNNHNYLELSRSEPSCCQTIIAAASNTVEFLQTQNVITTQLLNYSTTSILYTSNIFESTSYSKLIFNDTHSPPLIEDIPIFTSSLLI